jgi:hypothetical protein
MLRILMIGLQVLNQLLTAGIAITAFSLLLYALTFNLRDRVARSFAIILFCVVIVFTSDALGSIVVSAGSLTFWLQLQWVGIVFLPAAYLQFSDALLATTGKPSRGRRRLAVRIAYLVALVLLITFPFSNLVGDLVQDTEPAPHLERTWLTWVFTIYYVMIMVWCWINFVRAYQRTVTSSSQRRMRYLIAGSLAPALGSYPYLLFGSGIAASSPLLFWSVAVTSNILVSVLLIIMAYSVAFFGVSWPDRVVKRRLFKWLMRGPVTASSVLAITTLVRRFGETYGLEYAAIVPVVMIISLLLMEYAITLAAPLWERWLFHGGDLTNIRLLQTLEERLLTVGDLHQFLESVVAAVCDRMQVSKAFIVALGTGGAEMLITIGDDNPLEDHLTGNLINEVTQNGSRRGLFIMGDYWLVPLYEEDVDGMEGLLLGLLGVAKRLEGELDQEQHNALEILAQRAALALQDRHHQQEVFSSLEDLTPEIERIQRLRAAARYDGTDVLTTPDLMFEADSLSIWVKDALSHYWGGPKLSDSPMLKLQVVQRALQEHQDNPVNALRAILREAVDRIRPEGERRFTAEWILYNILEMKFMEGRKVREVALRLAMSEADLYRKQRVAIEAVAAAIMEMESKMVENNKKGENVGSEKILEVLK